MLRRLIEELRRVVEITFKSAPEYKSVEVFAEFLADDERETFTHEDLQALSYRTRTSIQKIKKDLEGYGFKLARREPEKRTRGFRSSSHDRWFGPGS